VHCAPIREERVRSRVGRRFIAARKTEAFAVQQNFDTAAAALVQSIPIPRGITDWIPLTHSSRRGGGVGKNTRKIRRFSRLAIAVLVIAIVGIFQTSGANEPVSGRNDCAPLAHDREFNPRNDARSGEDRRRRTWDSFS